MCDLMAADVAAVYLFQAFPICCCWYHGSKENGLDMYSEDNNDSTLEEQYSSLPYANHRNHRLLKKPDTFNIRCVQMRS